MGQSDVPHEQKKVAQAAASVFGGMPEVWSYADEKEQSKIDILSSVDSPSPGITSYATVGLCDYSIDLTSGEKPLRVELVGQCATRFEVFANILSTCAFNIINSKFEIYPGAVFRDVVKMYIPDAAMQHVLFVPPFGWEQELHTLEFPAFTIAWLMAVPISERELQYMDEYGLPALEEILEKKQVNVNDLERKTVI